MIVADKDPNLPKSEAINVNRGELELAFERWDARYDPADTGADDPASKAAYFFGLLMEGKGRMPDGTNR